MSKNCKQIIYNWLLKYVTETKMSIINSLVSRAYSKSCFLTAFIKALIDGVFLIFESSFGQSCGPKYFINVCHSLYHIMQYTAFSFQQYVPCNNLSRIPIRGLYQIRLQSWLASLCILFSAMTNKCPSYRAVCNRFCNGTSCFSEW